MPAGFRAVGAQAGIIDRIEDRPPGPGRPPVPTVEVVEALHFFVREGVQWRELRAAPGRPSGTAIRSKLIDEIARREPPFDLATLP